MVKRVEPDPTVTFASVAFERVIRLDKVIGKEASRLHLLGFLGRGKHHPQSDRPTTALDRACAILFGLLVNLTMD